MIRVFPSKTRATPDDDLVRFDEPTLWDLEGSEVHISVSFTWDIPSAHQLAEKWNKRFKVKLGGPALGSRGEEFEPGRYLKKGYVITSRGCPNKCWFCSVPKREGDLRELQIKDGWNVLDDNLLACTDEHIRNVFAMLSRQKERCEFTGGLEAKRLKEWHCQEIAKLRCEQMFFAYDEPADLEPLRDAGSLLIRNGFKSHRKLRAYVLCGFPRDDLGSADKRMRECWDAGFMPMAMLWRDARGTKPEGWGRFQREWARPAIIRTKMSIPSTVGEADDRKEKDCQ